MDNAKLAGKLVSIAQLDYDAILAYEEAIKRIDKGDMLIRDSLEKFRDDHARHVGDLEKAVIRMGQPSPSLSKDIKGRLIEGMTALMGAAGTSGALKAMQQNERLTNKTYRNATSDAEFAIFPEDVRMLLQKNYEDEKRHLSFIESTLETLAAASKK